MGDISASSAEWRRLVVKDAQEYYERYQTADQYSRLSMKPTPSLELGDTRWARVDRRGASILLGAVPEDVKKELIASRSKSTLDVLARLMVLYRPGSALEKGQLLRRIESPEPATTTQEAVEGLRQWLRLPAGSGLEAQHARSFFVGEGAGWHVEEAIREWARYHLKVDFYAVVVDLCRGSP